MKSIFIDCNNQLAPVFARVRRPDDPPIAVNTDAFSSADLPRLLAGYDICLDDHSYMPTEVMAECRGLKHIVFLGTGASSYMDVPALADLGITVHTIKGYGDIAVAEHTIALIFACGRGLARMDRAVRAGHPWIFSGAVASGLTDCDPGEAVRVCTHDGRVVGVGYANLRTTIAVRLLAHEDVAVDAALVARRLDEALALRTTSLPARYR